MEALLPLVFEFLQQKKIVFAEVLPKTGMVYSEETPQMVRNMAHICKLWAAIKAGVIPSWVIRHC